VNILQWTALVLDVLKVLLVFEMSEFKLSALEGYTSECVLAVETQVYTKLDHSA
jgi:hypothetical protein